jgi:hypothetical protein
MWWETVLKRKRVGYNRGVSLIQVHDRHYGTITMKPLCERETGCGERLKKKERFCYKF